MKIIRILVSIYMLTMMVLQPVQATEQEQKVLLHKLLNIPDLQHSYIDSQGQKQYDSLQAYKAESVIYKKYVDLLANAENPTQKDIKYFLFIGYTAVQRKAAATLEALAEDVMPLYQAHPQRYLNILHELPYLIATTCYHLNRYFGFEDKNKNKKSKFIETHRPLILKILGPEKSPLCLCYFDSIETS